MIELKVDRDMSPTVLVYYEIDKFHQNHFKYQSSKDSKQVSTPGMNLDDSLWMTRRTGLCTRFVRW